MRTLALLARKGGVGKSTLALHMAVIAQEGGKRVVIVDCDPQRSSGDWWRARESGVPELVEADAAQLRDVAAAAEGEGVDLLVVDTRPSVERDTADAALVANFILIPTRPAILDLRAIGATVEVVKAARTPAAIVLNQCPPSRGFGEPSITAEARRGLAAYGLPVVPGTIQQRADLAHALISGQAVTEFAPSGKAAGELRQLWRWTEERLWPNERA